MDQTTTTPIRVLTPRTDETGLSPPPLKKRPRSCSAASASLCEHPLEKCLGISNVLPLPSSVFLPLDLDDNSKKIVLQPRNDSWRRTTTTVVVPEDGEKQDNEEPLSMRLPKRRRSSCGSAAFWSVSSLPSLF